MTASTASLPTMTTGASISTKERPSPPAKEPGGPLRFQNVIRLSSHTTKGHPQAALCDRHRRQRRHTATPSSYGMSPDNTSPIK